MNKIRNGGKLTSGQVGFLLIVPGLAVFVAIILYPFVDAILMSFTNRSCSPGYDVVGLYKLHEGLQGPVLRQDADDHARLCPGQHHSAPLPWASSGPLCSTRASGARSFSGA